MNEVEKMYRNAHVYPRVYGDITKETFENKVFNMGDMCNEAFTAEKQLELIKWLANRIFPIHIGKFKGKHYFGDANFNSNENHFEEALATRVNDLWNILTDAERKQIKEILSE